MSTAEERIQEALAAFDFGAPVVGALRYGQGHINDTFVVHTQPEDCRCRRFILQRMSAAAFKRPDELMENIIGVTEYLGREIEKHGGDRDREAMRVLRPRSGEPFFTDGGGGVWRVYPFVEHTICCQSAESAELFAASGRAFGRFRRLLGVGRIRGGRSLLCALFRALLRVRDGEGGLDAAERIGGAAAQIHSEHAALIHYDRRGEDAGVCTQFELHTGPARAQLKNQLIGLLCDARRIFVRVRQGDGGQRQHQENSEQQRGPL